MSNYVNSSNIGPLNKKKKKKNHNKGLKQFK